MRRILVITATLAATLTLGARNSVPRDAEVDATRAALGSGSDQGVLGPLALLAAWMTWVLANL